jgi:hypothetical protein
MGTLLFDLLTPAEDRVHATRFESRCWPDARGGHGVLRRDGDGHAARHFGQHGAGAARWLRRRPPAVVRIAAATGLGRGART